jgi:hypothetical protein
MADETNPPVTTAEQRSKIQNIQNLENKIESMKQSMLQHEQSLHAKMQRYVEKENVIAQYLKESTGRDIEDPIEFLLTSHKQLRNQNQLMKEAARTANEAGQIASKALGNVGE